MMTEGCSSPLRVGGRKRKRENWLLIGCDGARKKTEEKDWSSIPELVMDLIAKRLCLPDLYRFGCVCKQWSSSCDPLLFPGHMPWLILPFFNNDETYSSSDVTYMGFDTEKFGFLSLYNGKSFKAELPELCNRRICGSFPGGWLMTVHANSQVQLFHPFSTKKTVIHLPPLTKFPDVLGTAPMKVQSDDEACSLIYFGTKFDTSDGFYYKSSNMRDRYISKVAMSSSSIANGTIIMAIQGVAYSLALYRFGGNQDSWAPATPNQKHFHFHDVTYYKGMFYAVHANGYVIVIHGLDEEEMPVQGFLPYGEQIISQHPGKMEGRYYIVESSGDLLVVQRLFARSEGPNTSPYFYTVQFKVFKLEFGTPNSWVELHDLGDCSLFLGYSSSFSLLSSCFTGCNPNCIYFTDNSSPFLRGQGYGSHDLGVFNLEDGRIEKFLHPMEALVPLPPPIWFAPFPLS